MKKILLFSLVALGIQTVAVAQWEQQDSHFSRPGIGVIDMKAVNSQVVWAVGMDMSGPGTMPSQYFTRTLNGGQTWMADSIPGATGMNMSSVTAVDASNVWVSLFTVPDGSGSTSGRIYKTTNGGTTWTQQATNAFLAPTGFVNKVHFFDVNNGVALGNIANNYFEIYTTTNSGDTWTRVPQANLPPALANERAYINVFSAVGNKIWYGTTSGRVLISNDRGLNWTAHQTGLTRQDPLLPLITNIEFRDAMNGLAQNDSTMRRSIDGGVTWNSVNFSGPLHHFDLRYIPGTGTTWMSSGANQLINDIGTSISHDDGNTWVTIDDTIAHTKLEFIDMNTGWSGGLNSDPIIGGMFRWLGPTSRPALVEAVLADIFPNPTNGHLNITGLKPGFTAEIEVFDVLGRAVLRQVIGADSGSGNLTLQLPATAKGIHYVLLKQNGEQQRSKLLVR